jgi:hypothetical protein
MSVLHSTVRAAMRSKNPPVISGLDVYCGFLTIRNPWYLAKYFQLLAMSCLGLSGLVYHSDTHVQILSAFLVNVGIEWAYRTEIVKLALREDRLSRCTEGEQRFRECHSHPETHDLVAETIVYGSSRTSRCIPPRRKPPP